MAQPMPDAEAALRSAQSQPETDDSPPSPPRKRPRTLAPQQSAAPATPATVQVLKPAPAPTSEPERFRIQPLQRFQGASSSIKRPREIAHFSYDEAHTYRDDDSSLSYYHPPQLGTDLKQGFDTFNHFEETTDQHIDSLLRALITQEKREGKKEAVDFVTWRGMMTKIMTAPFDMFAEFSMFATKYDGTIYIEEDFPSRAAQRAAEADRPPPRYQDPNQPDHKMMTYWGYKFETLSMLPRPSTEVSEQEIQARTRATVSNHAQYCSIVRTGFGANTLLLGGEVDGLSSPRPPATSPDAPVPWVELKTSEELPPRPRDRDVLKFERKLLKFWAQSFLLGVPKVIVGWRSKQGILTSVQELDTNKIPGMVRRGSACWDGNVCINFTAEFLAWLKRTVTEGGVYSLTLRKKAGVVEVQRVTNEGVGDIVSKEFLEWRENLKSKGAGEKAQDGQ